MPHAHDPIDDPAGRVPDLRRRRLLTGLLAGVGGSLLLGATGTPAFAASEATQPDAADRFDRRRNVMRNAGAGMHSGPDTAMGISTFTISPTSVSCGVGSFGNSAVPLPSSTGPFAMMMWAQRIDSYVVDATARTLTATGTMRSITDAATQTIEDVEHPFVAIARDNRGAAPDEFHLHFKTPFWNTGNPMATPSTLTKTWAMFGSAILLGKVNVG